VAAPHLESSWHDGGSLPLNASGGGLSYTHAGMYGTFAITEGACQLRGEAAAQVWGADIGVVAGTAGYSPPRGCSRSGGTHDDR
jgi:acetyl-CoA acetyltransferase